MCCREILYSGTRWGGRSTVVSFFFSFFFYSSVKPPQYYCSSRAYFSLFFHFSLFSLAPDRDHLLCRAHDEQARDDLQYASKNYRFLFFFLFRLLILCTSLVRTSFILRLNRHRDHLTVKRLPFSSYQRQ